MAVVKVTGTVSKVFGSSSQGLSLVEKFKGINGDDYTRSWSVWFAVAHNIAEGSEVTIIGQLSYKIEDFDGKDGKPGRKVKLDINNAQVAESKPAPVVADTPF